MVQAVRAYRLQYIWLWSQKHEKEKNNTLPQKVLFFYFLKSFLNRMWHSCNFLYILFSLFCFSFVKSKDEVHCPMYLIYKIFYRRIRARVKGGINGEIQVQVGCCSFKRVMYVASYIFPVLNAMTPFTLFVWLCLTFQTCHALLSTPFPANATAYPFFYSLSELIYLSSGARFQCRKWHFTKTKQVFHSSWEK